MSFFSELCSTSKCSNVCNGRGLQTESELQCDPFALFKSCAKSNAFALQTLLGFLLFMMSLYPNHAADKGARFFARFESVHNLPPPHVAHAHGGVENAWEAPKPEYVKRAMVTQTTFIWGAYCLKRQPFSSPILEYWNQTPGMLLRFCTHDKPSSKVPSVQSRSRIFFIALLGRLQI